MTINWADSQGRLKKNSSSPERGRPPTTCPTVLNAVDSMNVTLKQE
jgi:hypothetical protein